MKKMIKVAIIRRSVAAASAPALPLNRETCVKELGCSEEITDFVLPVGMTINMDGTASCTSSAPPSSPPAPVWKSPP